MKVIKTYIVRNKKPDNKKWLAGKRYEVYIKRIAKTQRVCIFKTEKHEGDPGNEYKLFADMQKLCGEFEILHECEKMLFANAKEKHYEKQNNDYGKTTKQGKAIAKPLR